VIAIAMFVLGAVLVGGSFMFGFTAGLRYAPRGDVLLPKAAKRGGSSILEYADPTQAEY
jgi:hypothetical protein